MEIKTKRISGLTNNLCWGLYVLIHSFTLQASHASLNHHRLPGKLHQWAFSRWSQNSTLVHPNVSLTQQCLRRRPLRFTCSVHPCRCQRQRRYPCGSTHENGPCRGLPCGHGVPADVGPIILSLLWPAPAPPRPVLGLVALLVPTISGCPSVLCLPWCCYDSGQKP